MFKFVIKIQIYVLFLYQSVCLSVFHSAGWTMASPELLLDSSIRLWVVLPIVFITFFVGIIRHYVTQLLHSDKKVDLEQVSDRWEEVRQERDTLIFLSLFFNIFSLFFIEWCSDAESLWG